MPSEIIDELQQNIHEIRLLVDEQKFTVGDANNYLERYMNIHRKMEDLEKSRDNWRAKYKELKEKYERTKG